MESAVIKRSIEIAGHKTSVSLEDAFWDELKDIATGQRTSLSEIVAAIDFRRRHGNLSSAIRLFVLEHLKAQRKENADTGNAGDGDLHTGKNKHRADAQAPRRSGHRGAAAPSVLRRNN